MKTIFYIFWNLIPASEVIEDAIRNEKRPHYNLALISITAIAVIMYILFR